MNSVKSTDTIPSLNAKIAKIERQHPYAVQAYDESIELGFSTGRFDVPEDVLDRLDDYYNAIEAIQGWARAFGYDEEEVTFSQC